MWAFFAVHAVERFDLSVAAAGEFTLAMGLGMGLAAPLVGRIGDRRGYRRVLGWTIANCLRRRRLR